MVKKGCWTCFWDFARLLYSAQALAIKKIDAADRSTGPFAADFKAAAFLPSELKSLKKRHGENYSHKLMGWIANVSPFVEEVQKLVAKIREMHQASAGKDPLQTPPKRAKRVSGAGA